MQAADECVSCIGETTFEIDCRAGRKLKMIFLAKSNFSNVEFASHRSFCSAREQVPFIHKFTVYSIIMGIIAINLVKRVKETTFLALC
jgi:hypothetical protein